MTKKKKDKNKGHNWAWKPPPPSISVFIDDPLEGQAISMNHKATGTTVGLNGGVVQSMKLQVNRTSNPPFNGNTKAIPAPYGNWSTILDNTDCPTSGGYTLFVYAVDATGNTFGAFVDFIVP